MNVNIWSGVKVAVQSALAAAVAVTAVSKADPGVASTTSPPTAGDFVLMHAEGMTQIDNRVFRVANVVAGTSFELEGEDTTAYDTFTSGTFEVITFGTSVSTLTGINASGGDFDKIDITTIHDVIKKQTLGSASPIAFACTSVWDSADAGLVALKAASELKAERAVRFTFSTGQILLFNGNVGCTLSPGGTAQGLVTTPVEFTTLGNLTVYAS